MSILTVEHVSHDFGGRRILEDASFRLLKGEHVGLIGANGEGKTTFLNILTGKLKGPKRDAVILNSALSLYLGIDDCSIPECVKMANEIIDSGKAGDKLEQFVAATKEV